MTPRLIIKTVERTATSGEKEQLSLRRGINLLIGPSNSGKTRWLQMLDFLFGKEREARVFLGDEIAAKYTSIAAVISIGGKDHKLERQWRDPRVSEYVSVDGQTRDSRQLSEFFLKGVKIPALRFPRSRALGEYTWVELGWRVLLRHIYRQEKYWSDIADRQPPPEQHAAILQFLGLAEKLFSEDAQQYNDLRRQVLQATTRKEEFEKLVSEIAEGILPDYNASAGVTEALLDAVTTKLQREIAVLVGDRNAALERVVTSQPNDSSHAISAIDFELGAKRAELLSKIESVRKDHCAVSNRIEKLEQTRATLVEELARLDRARAAGEILVDLKVTHCPVCDQRVEADSVPASQCYCCKQPYDYPKTGERLSFEAAQVREEHNETAVLLRSLKEQQAALQRSLDAFLDELRSIENNLQPARAKIAGFLPPEIAVLDVKRGELVTRISNAERLKGLLRSRRDISASIDKLTADLRALEAKMNAPEDPIKWAQSADKLADGINTYLGQIRVDSKEWTQGKASVRLSDRSVRFEIGGSDWNSKLGGNYRCIFLMAYHYSLLKLTADAECHYPGLTIIDFPPNPINQLGKSKTLNYLLEPFLTLAKKPEMEESQIIVASRELQPIAGAHTVQLEKQWV